MSDPETYDEYEKKQTLHQLIEGYGAAATIHSPCPFCCEPDWMVFSVLEMEPVASRGATCKSCGRSAKLVFTRTETAVAFEIVQTGGRPPPSYLPSIRGVFGS
jgi:hypothetical protein